MARYDTDKFSLLFRLCAFVARVELEARGLERLAEEIEGLKSDVSEAQITQRYLQNKLSKIREAFKKGHDEIRVGTAHIERFLAFCGFESWNQFTDRYNELQNEITNFEYQKSPDGHFKCLINHLLQKELEPLLQFAKPKMPSVVSWNICKGDTFQTELDEALESVERVILVWSIEESEQLLKSLKSGGYSDALTEKKILPVWVDKADIKLLDHLHPFPNEEGHPNGISILLMLLFLVNASGYKEAEEPAPPKTIQAPQFHIGTMNTHGGEVYMAKQIAMRDIHNHPRKSGKRKKKKNGH